MGPTLIAFFLVVAVIVLIALGIKTMGWGPADWVY